MSAPDTSDSTDGGKTYQLSGDFRGAIVNIESTFVNSATAQDIEKLPPEAGEPPYKGLQQFDETDADHFLGRETLTATLVGRLGSGRFLAVIGASGSGKSSVVRAGLIPALRRGKPLADGALPPSGSDQWLIRVMTPTANPLDALAAALLPEAEPAAMTALRDQLVAGPTVLTDSLPTVLGDRPRLLLVIDQFEELFSLSRHEEERRAFIDNLVTAAAGNAPITIVIVLRADFYDRCAQYEGLRELVSRQQEYIGAMSREELFRVIVLPAARDNWKIQEGLVELMLDDVGDEPGALPLLSHALLETWERRRGRTMTLSGYRESGGVRGAIAKTAETVFRKKLTPEQRPIARMIFMRLTELGESADGETPDTRRRALFSELITRSTDATMLEAVLNILVDSRLVMTDLIPPGETKVVEVSHEALIREWPTLRDWLNQDREGLIRHRQLTVDVNDWLKLNRDPGALYRGAKLENALTWTADPPDPLSVTEGEFLEASRVAAEEEARRAERLAKSTRNQRILAGVAVVLLIGVIAAVLYSTGVFNPPAEKMSGDFKVAVAEFAVLDEDGNLIDAGDGGRRIGERIGIDLAGESSLDLSVWFDGEASPNHVPVGVVGEGIAGATDPATVAEKIGADMIIYGTMEPAGEFANLSAHVYAPPQFGTDVSRVAGIYELVSGIPVFDVNEPETEVWLRLDPYARAAARLMLGLRQSLLGDEALALAQFERAVEIAPDMDVAHYFAGQANIYLAQEGGVVDEERLAAAETDFAQALAANPDNARARIGAGSVHYLRAQAILDESTAADFTGDSVAAIEEAIAEANLALAAYEPVADGPEQIETYGVPIASLANYEAGIALRLLADAQYRLGAVPEVEKAIDEAIVRLEPVVAPLAAGDYHRQLVQTYQALGTAYEWRGFLMTQRDDQTAAATAYERALDNYEACVAVGEKFPFDLFMQLQIIGPLCQSRIEALAQGEG